jgi:acetolactate synthase-1/2/3 large subunit
VDKALALLGAAKRPVFLLGSQVMLRADRVAQTVRSVERLGVPVYLSGMARGLLGKRHSQWFRHNRGEALKSADLVVLLGVPCDFRLNYGRHIGGRAKLIAVNLDGSEVRKNRWPTLGVSGDPASFLWAMADGLKDSLEANFVAQSKELRVRDDAREAKIREDAAAPSDLINPVFACRAIEEALDEDSVIVADGGDFVATASYITAPRSPLSWLDPGVFGTLGVGAGFALGAKLARPSSEVWIIYGDGSAAYTLMEFVLAEEELVLSEHAETRRLRDRYAPLVGFKLSAQNVEESRFPGSVRAHQPVALRGIQLKRRPAE